jgi:Beta-lactamase
VTSSGSVAGSVDGSCIGGIGGRSRDADRSHLAGAFGRWGIQWHCTGCPARHRVVYERGFGFANLEWRIPNDPHTKFELGSITKQFTALLVLQFVNEGKIRLNGHLTDYLPYYRQDTGARVSLHHLLSHTSGIPNFIAAPGFLEGTESRRSTAFGNLR